MSSVVCFVGSSGVGKTTVIENLTIEFKARGYRIAVIKHAPHGFDIDRKGKDSWRFCQAGADIIAIASRDRVCQIQQYAEEPNLERLIANVKRDVDLVLVEGFKHYPLPKIEVVRYPITHHLINDPEELLAFVCDRQLPFDLPQFGFQDTKAIANFLIQQLNSGALVAEVEKAIAP